MITRSEERAQVLVCFCSEGCESASALPCIHPQGPTPAWEPEPLRVSVLLIILPVSLPSEKIGMLNWCRPGRTAMRSSSENRFLKKLNLALCSSSCLKYIPLNYNIQLHHKFHSKKHFNHKSTRFSLPGKLSNLRQTRVWGLTPALPSPGFRLHFTWHHPCSNPPLPLYLHPSDWTQPKRRRSA